MGRVNRWTPQADAWLRELYPDHGNRKIARLMGRTYSAIKNRGVVLGLKKSPEYLEREKPGCFRKGQKPWNKGQSYQPGGRVKESQFKPGQVSHNSAPVGTEVVDSYGYLKRKVSDDRFQPSRKNWQFVHILKWEEYHGQAVPPGHAVRFADGDRQNFSKGNLVLVTRAENGVLNKFFAMENPPEGAFEVLLNLARIKLAANRRKRRNGQ